MSQFWIGVVLNICGSIGVNFGINIMKHSHSVSNIGSSASPKQQQQDSLPLVILGVEMSWTKGATMFALGSMCTFGSFAYGSQSLLASLGTLQFISNVFFTRFFLQEKLSWRVVIATFLIVVGVIITVSFSNHSSEVYTIQDLLQLYDQDYLFFLQVIGLVLLIQLLIYIIYTQRERSKYPLPLSMIIRPITFSSFAATIGSQSVLQSKCIAEVIRSSSSGDIQSSEWFIGVIVTVFITGIIIWLVCLNEALKQFDGTVIIPLLQVFWTISAIVQGGVYFKEFISFTTDQYWGFICGLAIVIGGVIVLTYKPEAASSARVGGGLVDDSTRGLTQVTADDSILYDESDQTPPL